MGESTLKQECIPFKDSNLHSFFGKTICRQRPDGLNRDNIIAVSSDYPDAVYLEYAGWRTLELLFESDCRFYEPDKKFEDMLIFGKRVNDG